MRAERQSKVVKSRTIESVKQKRSGAVPMVDNRDTAQMRMIAMMGRGQGISDSNSQVVQRQVPINSTPCYPHPVANTKYSPEQQSYMTIYNRVSHPRSNFSFGTATRDHVLRVHPHGENQAGDIICVRDDFTGQQTHPAGVQLDHVISWDKIARYMSDANYRVRHEQQTRGDDITRFYYSLGEARRYYNDRDNLHPVLASYNAAAGASGVPKMNLGHPWINRQVADIQMKWMNLQDRITHSSVRAQASDDLINAISQKLTEVDAAL